MSEESDKTKEKGNFAEFGVLAAHRHMRSCACSTRGSSTPSSKMSLEQCGLLASLIGRFVSYFSMALKLAATLLLQALAPPVSPRVLLVPVVSYMACWLVFILFDCFFISLILRVLSEVAKKVARITISHVQRIVFVVLAKSTSLLACAIAAFDPYIAIFSVCVSFVFPALRAGVEAISLFCNISLAFVCICFGFFLYVKGFFLSVLTMFFRFAFWCFFLVRSLALSLRCLFSQFFQCFFRACRLVCVSLRCVFFRIFSVFLRMFSVFSFSFHFAFVAFVFRGYPLAHYCVPFKSYDTKGWSKTKLARHRRYRSILELRVSWRFSESRNSFFSGVQRTFRIPDQSLHDCRNVKSYSSENTLQSFGLKGGGKKATPQVATPARGTSRPALATLPSPQSSPQLNLLPAGLLNPSNACFINATLQSLMSVQCFCAYILKLPATQNLSTSQTKKYCTARRALQPWLEGARKSAGLVSGIFHAVSVFNFSDTILKLDPNHQHDAAEFLIKVLDCFPADSPFSGAVAMCRTCSECSTCVESRGSDESSLFTLPLPDHMHEGVKKLRPVSFFECWELFRSSRVDVNCLNPACKGHTSIIPHSTLAYITRAPQALAFEFKRDSGERNSAKRMDPICFP